MVADDLVSIARAIAGEDPDVMEPERVIRVEDVEFREISPTRSAVERLLELIAAETSPFRLGEVLRCDICLELPVPVVKATYERLFELGADDALTRTCYARYLLLHGPDWDQYANAILAEVEPAARAAGLWDSTVLGHHPVFYSGPG